MRLHLLKALAVMVGLAAVSGCGGSSSSTAPSSTSTPTINIVGQNGTQAFSPNPASFAGQQVVFKNNDRVTHHIVLNDGSIDFGDIAPGATSRAVTMPASGTNYHCSIHPGMIGGISAAVFPFSIVINGGPASFTTIFQNQTMTNGQYDFILAPGTYTISGRLSSTSDVNVNLVRHSPVNCNTPTCPGGVVPGSIQSSISCGGTNCNPPTSSFCPTKPTQPCVGVAPGGKGSQSVAQCSVVYNSGPAGSACVPVPGDPSGTCAQQQNPYVPLDFQLQFTVDGTIASNASCQ